jgi:hypothetical protein
MVVYTSKDITLIPPSVSALEALIEFGDGIVFELRLRGKTGGLGGHLVMTVAVGYAISGAF